MYTNCYSPFELGSSWSLALKEELEQPYIVELATFVEERRRAGEDIYPPKELVFNALKTTPLEEVKVVIMGQDPYHGPGQAHGLSFSVPKGVSPPPSLKNIYKELASDVGFTIPDHGCLLPWAKQGVLLLNATLTVNQGDPLSHHGRGWERFTDAIIRTLAVRKEPLIFVLWGNSAKKKCEAVTELAANKQHAVITAAHPSPLSASRGFLGSQPFSKINEILLKNNKKQIDWELN